MKDLQIGKRISVDFGKHFGFINGVVTSINCEKALIKFDDGDLEDIDIDCLYPERKRGRKKLRDKFSNDALEYQIKYLKIDLKKAIDNRDHLGQKKIRQALRRRGYYGGLNNSPAPVSVSRQI